MMTLFRHSPMKTLLLISSLGLIWALWASSSLAPLVGVVNTVLVLLLFFEREPESSASPASEIWGNDTYEIVDKISEGGMGVVYRARHLELRREVAVKQIQPERLGLEARTRFKREARVLSGLTNPHTINVFDAGMKTESTFFYVMELLDGLNLQQWVEKSGPIPAARVIHILRQATMSLSEAHRKGLVHRDLKPANLMLCRYGGETDFVKVLDFGLVKTLQQDEGADQITSAGALPGTPAFLAPEGIAGAKFVDARADIYSLGAIGHYLLTAQYLFDEKSPVAMARAQLSTPPPRASERTTQPVPTELDGLISRCIEKDPAERPQDADALLIHLEELSHLYPWTRQQARVCWEGIPESFPVRSSQRPLSSEDL